MKRMKRITIFFTLAITAFANGENIPASNNEQQETRRGDLSEHAFIQKLYSENKSVFARQFGELIFKPGGGYPDLPKEAILISRTDWGYYIPAHMALFEPEGRRDVHVVSLKWLVEPPYIRYAGGLHGDAQPDTIPASLRLPPPSDFSGFIHNFIEDLKAGRRWNWGGVTIEEDGRVKITHNFMITEIIHTFSNWIYDLNQENHDFYIIEDAFLHMWKREHLRPSGMIIKVEKEPLPPVFQARELWNGIVEQDKNYWDALVEKLMVNEDFRKDKDAMNNFSMLRTSIANIYQQRGLSDEYLYALKQAVAIGPGCVESNHHLGHYYFIRKQYQEAVEVLENLLKHEKDHEKTIEALKHVNEMRLLHQREAELEKKNTRDPAVLEEKLELITSYAKIESSGDASRLADRLMVDKNTPPQTVYRLADILLNNRCGYHAIDILKKHLEKQTDDSRGWIELGWCNILIGMHDNNNERKTNHYHEAYDAWRKAVEMGGEPAYDLLWTDERFKDFWKNTPLDSPFQTLRQFLTTEPAP